MGFKCVLTMVDCLVALTRDEVRAMLDVLDSDRFEMISFEYEDYGFYGFIDSRYYEDAFNYSKEDMEHEILKLSLEAQKEEVLVSKDYNFVAKLYFKNQTLEEVGAC